MTTEGIAACLDLLALHEGLVRTVARKQLLVWERRHVTAGLGEGAVGFHSSMETLKRQMERRGVVYASRSNMAIVADVENETRGYFYAPGSATSIMAGGNWQPVLQSSNCSFNIFTGFPSNAPIAHPSASSNLIFNSNTAFSDRSL